MIQLGNMTGARKLSGGPRAFSFDNVEFVGSDCVLMETSVLGPAKAGDIIVLEELGAAPDDPVRFIFYLIRRIQDAIDNRGIAEDYVLILLKQIYRSEPAPLWKNA